MSEKKLKKIENLEKKIEKLLNKLKELEEEHLKKDKKLEEYLEGWKRAQAELINYKKEEEERLKRFKRFAELEFVKEMLVPVVDNLDRAIANVPQDIKESDFIKGIFSIRDNILKNLENLNIVNYGKIGDEFDPAFYEVIGEKQKKDMEGKVVEIVERGFKTKENLVIRPAKVILGK